MFSELGITDGHERMIVMGKGLKWAGGVDAPRSAEGSLYMEDLLSMGALEAEEKYGGKDAHETAFLCYSSVRKSS